MATIKFLKMYAKVYACEHDISLDSFHQSTSNLITTSRTYANDFGPSAKIKMAAIEIFKLYATDTPCDVFRNV